MTVRALSVTTLLVVALAACGEPVGPGAAGDPGRAEPEATATPAMAPDCEDLWSDWLGGGSSIPATPTPPVVDAGEIMAWVEREAPEDFGGLRMDPPGSGRITVSFTGDVDAHRAAVHERFGEEVTVEAVEWSMAELEALQREIDEEMRAHAEDPDRDRHRPPPGTIFSSGIGAFNRVSVGVVGGDDAALAELSARYGADRICLEVHEPRPPMGHDGPVRPLAKAEGWRSDLDAEDFPPYALVEIAYDETAARRAWQENVPGGLPARDDDDPAEDGVYGSLDDVDFATQAVVVWSAGQSGSCPGWLADIDVRDGRVEVEHGEAGTGACTSDYNPYRMLLAVERERLPAPGDLPQPEREGEPGGSAEVRAYP